MPLLLMLPQAPELRVDPLLLAEAADVWSVIAGPDNPVWPGWDASGTPILFYLPGVQDALVNHPAPPAGFVRASGPWLPEGWTLHLRDGATTMTLDGQNTSTVVAGIPTLVVADPLSNLRAQLALLLDDPRPRDERLLDLAPDRLAGDVHDELGMIVHEAFHVHQDVAGPGKSASEGWLLQYPWLAAPVNATFALEGELLARALETSDEEAAWECALRWLAVRRDRRGALPAQAVAYEDGTEFNEGLAKYTEWRLSEVLEGRDAPGGLWWRRGFRGQAELGAWRARLLRQLRDVCSGQQVVNGDPYGSGGLRFRLYSTGMAVGALLDRLGMDDWHARIFEPDTTLTGLVEELLAPDEAALAAALADARAADGWDALLAGKQAFEAKGLRAARAAAEAIERAPNLLTLDFSAVDASPGLTFTPFGLTRVDAARTIYGVIPMSGQLGSHASFQQERVAPVLVDTGRKTLSFALAGPPDLAGPGQDESPRADLVLELPGATVRARRARVRVEKGSITLVLVP